MGRIHFKIRRLKEEDEDALFDFRKRMLPAGSRDLDREYWRWKFLRHPYSEKVPFFIIEAEDRIVGTQGYWPMPLIAHGNEISCAHLVDFNVEDSFRGLPVVKLFKTVCSNATINFGANLSGEAKHFFKSARWTDASPYLYGLYCFQKKPNGIRGPVDKAKFAVRSAVTAFKIERAVRKGPKAYRIDRAYSCPQCVSNLIADQKQENTIFFKKDLEFFRWRYDQCPFSRYEYSLFFEEGILKALLVYTFIETNGVKKCLIMELIKGHLCQDSLSFFLAHHILYCKQKDISAIEATTSFRWIKDTLTRLGFRTVCSDMGLMFHVNDKGSIKIFSQDNHFPFICGDTDRY